MKKRGCRDGGHGEHRREARTFLALSPRRAPHPTQHSVSVECGANFSRRRLRYGAGRTLGHRFADGKRPGQIKWCPGICEGNRDAETRTWSPRTTLRALVLCAVRRAAEVKPRRASHRGRPRDDRRMHGGPITRQPAGDNAAGGTAAARVGAPGTGVRARARVRRARQRGGASGPAAAHPHRRETASGLGAGLRSETRPRASGTCGPQGRPRSSKQRACRSPNGRQ